VAQTIYILVYPYYGRLGTFFQRLALIGGTVPTGNLVFELSSAASTVPLLSLIILPLCRALDLARLVPWLVNCYSDELSTHETNALQSQTR